MRLFIHSPFRLLGFATGLAIVTWASAGIAAERVVLKYKILRASVSVAELATFAETGQQSPAIATYLRMSNQDPQNVQKTLNQEVKVSPVLLDRGLNNPIGDTVLDQIGQVVQTPSGGASRQAIRASLVLSASEDSRISLIEVIQNYPTQEVHVNGEKLVQAYRQLSRLERGLGGFLGDIFK
jgi:hypothetical protein